MMGADVAKAGLAAVIWNFVSYRTVPFISSQDLE